FDPSQSVLSVSSSWIELACDYGGYYGNFVATVTARDTEGSLLTDLDPSLLVFAASSTAVKFDPVVNNGDGTYSAPFTLAGDGPYFISVAFAHGPNIADATGNTDPTVSTQRVAGDPFWAENSTHATYDTLTPDVGGISTLWVNYAPVSTCAPSATVVQVQITSGTGRIVDTGAFPVSTDGQSATLSLSDGDSIPVQITSNTAGVVVVAWQGAFISPVAITFSTPQFDASQSRLAVSSTWVSQACGAVGFFDDFVATVTAKDSSGSLLPDLDTSLLVFAASSSDVVFGQVVNNGDGTYSAPFTLSGEGPYTISAAYDGGAKIADDKGNTDPRVALATYRGDPDWVATSTHATVDKTSVVVGDASTMTVSYARSVSCAPASATVQVRIVSGDGRIVDTGAFPVSADGQTATLSMSDGDSVPVQITSTVAGVVSVAIPGTMIPYIVGTPIDITFATSGPPTPGLDPSQSVLSVSSTWMAARCGNGGYNDNFVATVTAVDYAGARMSNLDPSLMEFASSSGDVVFGQVVNNGDGTYSAPFTLAGEGPYTISAAYDGSAKIADSTGNTDPSVGRNTLHPVMNDWVTPATTITATPAVVGAASTISITYAPSNPSCAPASVDFELLITSGEGTFVSPGTFMAAADVSKTQLTVPAGSTASVMLTSNTVGTVTVSVTAPSVFVLANLSGSPINVVFAASDPSHAPAPGSMTLSVNRVVQGQSVTATAALSQGNIAGVPVTFTLANHATGAVVGTQTCNTNASGACSVTLLASAAGTYDVSASFPSGGSVVQLTSAALTLTVDPVSQPAGPVAPAQTTIAVATGGVLQTSSPWGVAAVTMAVLGLAVALLFRRQVRSSAMVR
ncbi:MAG: hypothetical protein FWD63_08810, partial [Propionibacteriaceae bacterium]|nr:hypothetical protein [Propionibacteriaceae bacterium]